MHIAARNQTGPCPDDVLQLPHQNAALPEVQLVLQLVGGDSGGVAEQARRSG